jgi:hypothetical protein
VYGSLGVDANAANLGMSMGVNIGTYGYQNGRGNLLQQINYSRSAQDGPGEGEEDQEAEEAEDNDD